MNVAERAVTTALALPGAAARRTAEEAAGIWHDAQAVAGHGRSQLPAHAIGSSTPSPVTARGLPAAPSADQVYFAWYGGLGAMAVLRMIEWRLAAVVAVAHTVERYGHRRRVREFVEGLDSGL